MNKLLIFVILLFGCVKSNPLEKTTAMAVSSIDTLRQTHQAGQSDYDFETQDYQALLVTFHGLAGSPTDSISRILTAQTDLGEATEPSKIISHQRVSIVNGSFADKMHSLPISFVSYYYLVVQYTQWPSKYQLSYRINRLGVTPLQ